MDSIMPVYASTGVWMVDQWLMKGSDSQCNICDSQYLRSNSSLSHKEVKESNNKQETYRDKDKANLI